MKEVKGHIKKIGKDAKQTVDSVKQGVNAGVKTTKEAADQVNTVWKKFFGKERVRKGLDITSKGVAFVAKGARMASKGAESLADGVEKASKEIGKLGSKLEK